MALSQLTWIKNIFVRASLLDSIFYKAPLDTALSAFRLIRKAKKGRGLITHLSTNGKI